jgi:hypothetical protein
MVERCRCGAELLPQLHFCVACGAERGRVPVGAGRARTVGAGPDTDVTPVVPPLHGRAVEATMTLPAYRPRSLPPSRVARPEADMWATGRGAGSAWSGAGSAVGGRPVGHRSAAPQSATPRSATPWIAASAVVMIVAVLVVAGVLVLRPGAGAAPVAAPVTTPAAPTSAAPASASASPILASPPSSTGFSSSTSVLDDLVAGHRFTVESTVGYWVPQVSSRKPGMTLEGHTYTASDIADEYVAISGVHPEAALLWSGDWPVFTSGDYWVTIIARPFTTAAEANAWCDVLGFGADDCFAKTLSHTGGPQGTTVHR